jgi:hypothetical protein
LPSYVDPSNSNDRRAAEPQPWSWPLVLSARRVARQEGRAGRSRAVAVGLTCRHGCGGTFSLHTDLPFTVSGPTRGGYSGRAVVLKTGAAGVPSPSRRVSWPFRQRLIGQRYPGPGVPLRRRRRTLTGQRHQPLCSGDRTKRPDGLLLVPSARILRPVGTVQPAAGRARWLAKTSARGGAWLPIEAETCDLPN